MSHEKIAHLTKREIFALPDGTHRLEPHLYVRVRSDGRYRNFFFRYVDASGASHDVALGSATKTPFCRIKQQAYFLKQVWFMAGGRKESGAPVKRMPFQEYAAKTIALLASVKLWKNPAQEKSWRSSITAYAYPKIGEKFIDEVTRDDILSILRPIWHEKTMTASKLRGRLEKIFSYAINEGIYCGENPAKWEGSLELFLAPPHRCAKSQHFATISLTDLKTVIVKLQAASSPGAKAILFGILTATRSVEFTQMKWSEVDFKNAVWTCPPERRKDGKKESFRVPLSSQALDLLKEVRQKRDGSYVFSVDDKAPIRRETPRKYLRASLKVSATMHGMRSVFRDWCAENNIDQVVAEKCLMHTTGSVSEMAYQRSDLLELRRTVLQSWADAILQTAC